MEPVKKEKRQRKRSDRRSRQRRKARQSESVKARKHSLLPTIRVGTHRSSLPLEPIKKVVEPKVECAICNQPIDLIASAMSHPNGGYAHFDCVLEHLQSERKLSDDHKISYIGRGIFAVVHQDESGAISFTEEIVWENPQEFNAMKKYVEESKQ